MMPLGLSVGAAAASALGKSTWAADSIVTAVVTMKMISRTRKISVNGVMLMSANTPPPSFLVIAIGKYLCGYRCSGQPPGPARSTSSPCGVGQLRARNPLGRDCNLFGACALGDVQNSHHVAEQHFAITLEHHDFLVHFSQRLAQARSKLALGNVLRVHEELVLSRVGHDDALVLRRGVGRVGQINVGGRLDSDRSRHHEDDQQYEEYVGERGDIDAVENTAAFGFRSAN